MLNTFQSLVLIAVIFIILFGISLFWTKTIKTKINKKNNSLIRNYMGFIYLVFGFLKLYDLNKFANIFSKYDIIAKKIVFYAYLYPFIEIALGISLLTDNFTLSTMTVTKILMIISIISVIISMYAGQNLRCGCLGSFFHIPLSYVTISENVAMLSLSLKY